MSPIRTFVPKRRKNPRRLLERALAAHGITDAARIESHIRGCDLSRPVFEKTLKPGQRFCIWVRNAGLPGKYACHVNEDPTRLGIIMEGRHRELVAVREALTVVLSTAATFPAGLVERVGGMGGGIQYLLPPDWLTKVERVP